MRSALSSPIKISLGFLALATLLVFGLMAGAQQKVNPKTGIAWPVGCGVYNVSTNTCPPVGGINFRGAWSSSTTYAINDAVFDSGSTYVSLQAGNLNHNPLTSPTFWTLFASGGAGTPGGPALSIQFNASGLLGGSSAITTDPANQSLLVNAVNPTPDASACGSITPALCIAGLWTSSTQAAAEADPTGIAINPVFAYGPCFSWGNPGPGGWCAQKGFQNSMDDYSRGITQAMGSFMRKFAVGDTANYFYVFADGGTTAESDEGVCAMCTQAIQFGGFYTGTVNAGQTTGTQTLSATSTGGLTCDGCYLTNRTTGAATGGHFVPYVLITAYTFDGTSTFVFTAANSLIVGQTMVVYGFNADPWINALGTVTVASSTQFTLVVPGISHSAASATELGVGRFGAFRVAGTAAMAQQVAGVSLTPTSARGTMNVTPVAVTAWSISGDIATFTAPNALAAGESLILTGFGTSTFFNYNPGQQAAPGTPGQPVVVLSSGLSSTHFSVNFIHANGSATEAGTATQLMPVIGTTSPPVFTSVVDITDNISSFPTTANLVGCLTGGQPEQVKFTAAAASGGHQFVTITYRQPHGGPSIGEATTLWYGGPCGTYIDQLEQNTRRAALAASTYFVVGALDSTHIAYAWNIRGQTTNNAIPSYEVVVPYTSALRTGSTVTATLPGGFTSVNLNNAASATVVAASNSALLGTATSPTSTLNAIGVEGGISFTQAGTNGDTSASIYLSLPSSVDAFNMYCGAEVVAPSTPSPGTPTTLHLEPNNCVWSTSDVIWNPLNPSYNTEGVFENVQQNTPSNSGLSQGIGMLLQGSGIDANFIPFFVAIGNPVTDYVGHGGTEQAGPFMRLEGVIDGLPIGSIFSLQHSGLAGAPIIQVDHDEFDTDLTFQRLVVMEGGQIGYYNPTQTWFLNNISTTNLNAVSVTGDIHGNLFGNAIGTRTNYFCIENLAATPCTDGVTNNNLQLSGIVFDSSLHNVIGTQWGQGGDLRMVAETPGGISAFLAGIHVYGDIYTTTSALSGQTVLNGTNPNAYIVLDGTIGAGCGGNVLIGWAPGSCSPSGYALNVKNNLYADSFTTPAETTGTTTLSGTVAFPVKSGTLTNTDLNGHLTIGGGGSVTYTFTSPGITNNPECIAVDTSGQHALQVNTSTTTLTIAGTIGDNVSYICSGHN